LPQNLNYKFFIQKINFVDLNSFSLLKVNKAKSKYQKKKKKKEKKKGRKEKKKKRKKREKKKKK